MSIQFHTEFQIPNQAGLFSLNTPILSWGSCFADEMIRRMLELKCRVNSNSHGIIFNAAAINKAIADVVNIVQYEEKDLFKHNNLWHSWHHHGSFSNVDIEVVLQGINTANQVFHDQLKDAELVVLTLGTAWVYYLKDQQIDVANCHKMPGQLFEKRLQNVQEIKSNLQNSIDQLKTLKPELNILLTVSPVRYLKDGVVENSRSKAHLLCAVHEIVDTNNQCFYFPAYELMVDDLRDYRFMASDLAHPSVEAVDYIWEKFLKTYLTEADQKCISEIKSFLLLKAHKPMHIGSSDFYPWQDRCLILEQELKQRYPHLLWD